MNDTAEITVKLMEDYNNLLTINEHQNNMYYKLFQTTSVNFQIIKYKHYRKQFYNAYIYNILNDCFSLKKNINIRIRIFNH